jgi:hypothetical protein
MGIQNWQEFWFEAIEAQPPCAAPMALIASPAYCGQFEV